MLPELVLTVTALAVCGLVLVSGSQDCQSMENMKTIQRVCKKENEAIVLADGQGDNTSICGHFHVVLKCAVAALPHCYDYVEGLFAMYYHSPYNCQHTQELIMELQEIIMKGIHGDKTSSATEGPPPSTSQAVNGQSVYTHSSTDQGQQGTEESNGRATKHPEQVAHEGNKENGSVMVVPRSLSVAWSVLAAATLLWSFSS